MPHSVILNVIPNSPALANEVYHVAALTKTRILKALELAADPANIGYCLALAEDINMPTQADPDDMLTADEWLERRKVPWNASDRKSFSYWASRFYYESRGFRPTRVYRPGITHPQGNKLVAYALPKDKEILLKAYDKVIERQNSQNVVKPKVRVDK